MDYVPVDEELTFSGSALIQSVIISILPDDIVEQDETFTVSISSNDSAVSIDQQTATITIFNSDECMSFNSFIELH